MNIEKFSTALSKFIEFFREFIPQTLGHKWEDRFCSSLDEKSQKQWQANRKNDQSSVILLDFGTIEAFAKSNFTFWQPWFGDDRTKLTKALETIRKARNLAYHKHPDLTQEKMEEAYSAMIMIFEQLGKTQLANEIRQLIRSSELANDNPTHALRGRLRRTLNLQSLSVFMRIRYVEERKDLQDYLNTPPPRVNLFQGELAGLIDQRITRYLKDLDLMDAHGNLTAEGKTLAQTGLFWAYEQGHYRIWYCPYDELLGESIVYYEYEDASPHQQNNQRTGHQSLSLPTDEPHFRLSTQKNESPHIFYVEHFGNPHTEETLVGDSSGVGQLSLVWEWEGLSAARLRVESGRLTKDKKTTIDISSQVLNLELNQEYWIQLLFGQNWDFATNRYKYRFEDLKHDTYKRDFVVKFNFDPVYGFDSIEFDNVPLMASDQEQALKWRNWLVEQTLKEKYLNQVAVESLFRETNAKPGLAPYNLKTPDPIEYLKSHLEPEGAKNRGKAYWHLAAPHDLQPVLPTTN